MSETMPALFVGHGSPMNAIEDNEFSREWRRAALEMPRPRAVLCVSAHWETDGVCVTSAERHETIHDFFGFPPELFAVRYPAPGDPELARRTAELLGARLDLRRGLDHGAWSVLRVMYPQADVPVLQLSLDSSQPASWHYDLAAKLAPLRNEGVLMIGSGNIVHNLRMLDWRREDGYDWADRFNGWVKQRISSREHAQVAAYETLAPDVPAAVPTPEHFLPLLYVLAARGGDEDASFFCDKTVMGSISMTCVRVGA